MHRLHRYIGRKVPTAHHCRTREQASHERGYASYRGCGFRSVSGIWSPSHARTL